jgi:hypothetical protein
MQSASSLTCKVSPCAHYFLQVQVNKVLGFGSMGMVYFGVLWDTKVWYGRLASSPFTHLDKVLGLASVGTVYFGVLWDKKGWCGWLAFAPFIESMVSSLWRFCQVEIKMNCQTIA